MLKSNLTRHGSSTPFETGLSGGMVSGIGTLFSLDHKLCASDYDSDSDSDSVTSENQPYRTLCRPIQSVIILVIKQIGLPLRGRLILFNNHSY